MASLRFLLGIICISCIRCDHRLVPGTHRKPIRPCAVQPVLSDSSGSAAFLVHLRGGRHKRNRHRSSLKNRLKGGGKGPQDDRSHLKLQDILDKDVASEEEEKVGQVAVEEVDYKYEYRKLLVEVEALRQELRSRTQSEHARDDGGKIQESSSSESEEMDLDSVNHAKHHAAHEDNMRERAKYIPMRLSIKERKLLRLLEAALSVSEYVDRVDVISFKSRSGRMVSMIKEVCSILCGLLVSSDYKEGQRLIENKNYADNEEFFQKIFEVGRRHKIMNPEKMRSTYGKLIYMLQDAESPEVSEVLGFKCVKEIRTVFSFLQYAGAVELLNDPLVQLATSEIRSENRSREQVNADIRHKEKAVEHLARKYRSEKLEEEDIRCCLYSIGDNNAFLRFTRDPCEKMLEWLRSKFNPELPEDDFSLAIIGGRNGARLTHSHSRQYRFVEQSLMLWSAILKDMFKLWHLSEQDLLSSLHPYKLRDTGQGLNRVQHSPRIGSEMERILHSVQSKLQSKWEGSSVVHLGDHNVPNALMFIDKYTQVERILNPVVLCIEKLPQLYASDKGIRKYLDSSFGSVEHLSKMILSDFFRSAFDGSGADNFFDAGSCIDGRLTSAWNWCSRIERKPYFPAFLLTGFTGFDGKFE